MSIFQKQKWEKCIIFFNTLPFRSHSTTSEVVIKYFNADGELVKKKRIHGDYPVYEMFKDWAIEDGWKVTKEKVDPLYHITEFIELRRKQEN